MLIEGKRCGHSGRRWTADLCPSHRGGDRSFHGRLWNKRQPRCPQFMDCCTWTTKTVVHLKQQFNQQTHIEQAGSGAPKTVSRLITSKSYELQVLTSNLNVSGPGRSTEQAVRAAVWTRESYYCSGKYNILFAKLIEILVHSQGTCDDWNTL